MVFAGHDDEGAARRTAVARTGLGDHADEAFERVVRLAARLLGVPQARVVLVGGDAPLLPPVAGAPAGAPRVTPVGAGLAAEVVHTGAVLRVDDLAVHPRRREHPARNDLGRGAYLGVPLHDADGVVLGALEVVAAEPRAWADEDVATLVDLALGVSGDLQARIAHAVAEEVRRERAEAARLLQLSLDASDALLSTADPALAAERLLAVVVPSLASWAALYLEGDEVEEAHIVARHHDPDLATPVKRFVDASRGDPVRNRIVDEVLAGRRRHLRIPAVITPGIGADLREAIVELGVGPGLLVPVATTRTTLGALLLVGAPGAEELSEAEVQLAVDLGLRAGLAIEHARASRRDKEIAITLQRSLLPVLPVGDGYELGSVYEPASQTAEVGGDWYDAAYTGEGLHLSIGDVTGHSIGAAAVMGTLRATIHALCTEGLAPDAVLRRIEASAGPVLDLAATAVVARLHPVEGGHLLRWSNAGHLPPVLVRAGGEAALLERPVDVMLGVTDTPPRHVHELLLSPGDAVVLYTDGLVEQRGQSIDEGMARLVEVLRAGPNDGDLHERCVQLIAALRPDGSDDVAVLVVRTPARR